MSYVLTAVQMKAIDKRAITELGLPARLLMENAGKGCADYILQHYSEYLNRQVIILHGDGNNSGDGYVIARWLFLAGITVFLCRVQFGTMSPDTKANREICKKLDIPMFEAAQQEDLSVIKASLFSCSLIIDAVFGIGFKGKLDKTLQELFTLVNGLSHFRIAIDLPSGLNSDTGVGEGVFHADATLCIHAPKLGSVLGDGKFISGKLHTISIGIPENYNKAESAAILIDNKDFAYPDRFHDAHKGAYGRVAVIGGSMGFLGSVNLAAKAALRAGAGYVNLLSREDLQYFYGANPAEIMFVPIPEDKTTGLPSPELLKAMLEKAKSIVIGPGMGLDKYAYTLLELVLKHSKVPTVLDADALRLIAENPTFYKYLKRPNLLLTPHVAEFSALAKTTVPLILDDPLQVLSTFVQETKARVLLKSHTTIFHDAQNTYVNTAGNDGLATGGSGDVLSGIIASFAAQGMELGKAAINASYLMGKTAEYLATKRGTPSIIPSDIIDNLFMAQA